jgi:hypothetical protein
MYFMWRAIELIVVCVVAEWVSWGRRRSSPQSAAALLASFDTTAQQVYKYIHTYM